MSALRTAVVALGGNALLRRGEPLEAATQAGAAQRPCRCCWPRMQPGQRWHPRRIVVGIDGSGASLAALTVADDIAARLGSTVNVEAATGGKMIDREGSCTNRV